MIKFPDRNTQSSEKIKFYFATKALQHKGYHYYFCLILVYSWLAGKSFTKNGKTLPKWRLTDGRTIGKR